MKIITVRPNGTKRVCTMNDEPSKTDPSFQEECDVNVILKKYMKTGQLTHLARNPGQYADVSQIPDLQGAMNTVAMAQRAFDDLPAEIRARFGNSPVQMVQFLQDPKNTDEAIKLGLAVQKESAPPSAGANKAEGRVSPKTPVKKNIATKQVSNDDELNDDE